MDGEDDEEEDVDVINGETTRAGASVWDITGKTKAKAIESGSGNAIFTVSTVGLDVSTPLVDIPRVRKGIGTPPFTSYQYHYPTLIVIIIIIIFLVLLFYFFFYFFYYFLLLLLLLLLLLTSSSHLIHSYQRRTFSGLYCRRFPSPLIRRSGTTSK